MQAQTVFWLNSTKPVTQLIIKHPKSDKTRRFLTAFTRTSHLTYSFQYEIQKFNYISQITENTPRIYIDFKFS